MGKISNLCFREARFWDEEKENKEEARIFL